MTRRRKIVLRLLPLLILAIGIAVALALDRPLPLKLTMTEPIHDLISPVRIRFLAPEGWQFGGGGIADYFNDWTNVQRLAPVADASLSWMPPWLRRYFRHERDREQCVVVGIGT